MFVHRPPNDNFTMRLFLKFASQIKIPHDKLYIWSAILNPNFIHYEPNNWYDIDEYGQERYNQHIIEHPEMEFRNQILNEIKNDLVMVGIKDHLTSSQFNPWVDKIPDMAKNLGYLFKMFDDKQFIFFTSLENIEQYYDDYPNLHIIPWGGDITNQMLEYKALDPITEKDMNSPYSFVCLNRGLRHPRAMLVSLLYGLRLEKNGMISCMFQKEIKNLLKTTNWQFTEDQTEIRDLFENGFKRFKRSKLFINDSKDIYGLSHNDNVSNFKNSLSAYYKQSFVELIGETSYTEPAFNITEKTLNSIYAYNFPIMISSNGSVKFLRDIGIDVFDDIIDHSYDLIKNPIDRMYKAITDNLLLLTDVDRTKQLWINSRHRFDYNLAFAKKNLYDFYISRAETRFAETLQKIEDK